MNPWLVVYAQPTGDSDDENDDDDSNDSDDSDSDADDGDEDDDGDELMRRVRQFKKMLRDHNIAPFANWEDSIPILMQVVIWFRSDYPMISKTNKRENEKTIYLFIYLWYFLGFTIQCNRQSRATEDNFWWIRSTSRYIFDYLYLFF